MTALRFMIVSFGATFASLAQAPISAPTFEVASVKMVPPDSSLYGFQGDSCREEPGQLSCKSVSLRFLILRAYGLKPYQLVSALPIDNDRYEIVAKIPRGSTREQVDLMLPSLLVERLGLVAHRENRNIPTYELVVAKNGPKLTRPEEPVASATAPTSTTGTPFPTVLDKDGLPVLPPGVPGIRFIPGALPPPNVRLSARIQTIAALFQMPDIDRSLGRPVVDKTGLTGAYDYTLTYALNTARVIAAPRLNTQDFVTEQRSSEGTGSEPGFLTFAGALENQLGLRLQSANGSVEVQVVDKVSRIPTAN